MEAPPSYESAVHYPTMPSIPSLPQYTYTSQTQSVSISQRTNLPVLSPQISRTTPITRPKMGEVRPFQDSNERRRHEELGDLYAIIKTTDALEAAFSRDAITSSAYAEACTRLISQFKSTESALITGGMITSAEVFMREFEVDCPRAYDRLIRSGVPATVLHVSHDDRAESVIVAETVQAFITAMDALKLDQRAVDAVQPLISDLMASLTKVHGLSPEFEGLVKMRLWLQKLNQMRAVEEISEEEARQLIFDLEGSYTAFHRFLSTGRK